MNYCPFLLCLCSLTIAFTHLCLVFCFLKLFPMPLFFFLISCSLFLVVHLLHFPLPLLGSFLLCLLFCFFPNHFSTLKYRSQLSFWAYYLQKKWKSMWFTTCCYVRHLITFKYLGQFSWRKALKNGSFDFHFYKDRSVNRVPTERETMMQIHSYY